jgi:hypothetical protein
MKAINGPRSALGRFVVQPIEERFFSKVQIPLDTDNACWIWKGACDGDSYGVLGDSARGIVKAHRWSYEFFKGQIPAGKELHHICENPTCVNPSHLEALTCCEHHLSSL